MTASCSSACRRSIDILAKCCILTLDVVVDDVVRVQVLQTPQNLLGHPNDLKLPHGPTAVQLLQDGASFSRLHEQVDRLVPEDSAEQLSDVVVAEAGLEFYVSRLKVLQGDLGGEWVGFRKVSKQFLNKLQEQFYVVFLLHFL